MTDNDYIGRIVKIHDYSDQAIYLTKENDSDIILKYNEEIIGKIIDYSSDEMKYTARILNGIHKNEKFIISKEYVEEEVDSGFIECMKVLTKLQSRVLEILGEV